MFDSNLSKLLHVLQFYFEIRFKQFYTKSKQWFPIIKFWWLKCKLLQMHIQATSMIVIFKLQSFVDIRRFASCSWNIIVSGKWPELPCHIWSSNHFHNLFYDFFQDLKKSSKGLPVLLNNQLFILSFFVLFKTRLHTFNKK